MNSPRYDIDAYLAGIFDGEGHISISCDLRRKWSIYVEIGATNTCIAPLNLLKKAYGGNVRPRTVPKGHKPCWCWKASGKDAHWALSRMQPWLLIKRHKAKVALSILKYRSLHMAG